jgi:predicted RNA binding protein YcfA (HicA-like mRNA interferase family)
MVEIRNWSFKDLVDFLDDYGFICGHIKGSHHYYNGRINGENRVVQAILSKKEKNSQSLRTMKMAIENSGISKKYFDEWKSKKVIHVEIIG